MKLKKIVTLLSNQIGVLRPQRAMKIESTALTDTGLVRANNEDSYLNLPEYQLWAVADGMGGSENGEIASAIAIHQLKNAIVTGNDLVTAIQQCHHAIEQAAIDGLGAKGMGSTIVALKTQNNHYQIAWVGDSRCYLWRSKLKCLSKDHSYIQLMLDQGLIKEADIASHPYKHAITQALGGIGTPIKVDSVEGKLKQGDVFLLCSDGLSGEVLAEDIEQTLCSHDKTLEEKARQLLEKALMTGGKDNIALILVEIGKNHPA